ncbi:MAG: nitrogenase component 1 [Lachnospiraceae bacterium]|nr:nitrogenase component 1 [Lachnospiraceae bacterium]
MLQRVGEEEKTTNVTVPISEAAFPMPFYEGLEYSSPARGVWNIAHTGMLIPEAHEIFVCALGCLRGVVLTAAEMDALDRYSAIELREENVINGGIEELMIEGVTDILHKLSYRPRAILLYVSCQHLFLGCDLKLVFDTLRTRFSDIHFVDCYMTPTFRKSGMTPTQRMQVQLYRMWEQMPADPKKVNLIGSNLETAPSSELVRILEDAGYEFWSIHRCEDFDDYLKMAEACLNLVYDPTGLMAAKDIKKRLGMDYLYLTCTYDLDELEQNYRLLAETLGTDMPDLSEDRKRAEEAIAHAATVIGDTPIVLDYTFTFRILSFARMLLEHGFRVTEVCTDAFLPEELENFTWIREHCPDIVISATTRPAMRFVHGDCSGQEETGKKTILALGQKAAYIAGTDHFVNVAESGGYYGYDGIAQIMGLMEDAFLHEKDRKTLIQQKGYGCISCL